MLTGDAGTDELQRLLGRAEASGPEAVLAFSATATGGPSMTGPVVRLGSDTALGSAWAAALRRPGTARAGTARRPG